MNIDNSIVKYSYLAGAKNFDVTPHRQNDRFLPFVVLTHVNIGEGYFEHKGKVYTIKAGQTMFVPECVLHNINSINPHNVSWAHISATSFKYNLMQNSRTPKIIKGESSLILRDYINRLATIKYKSPSDLFERDNCISGIFKELSKFDETQDISTPKPQWCISLQDYIARNIKNKFSLDDLAKEMLVSKSSLCHKFKKETGVSLIDYVLQEKIKASFYMLADGLTNAQIAEKLNLSDEYYFSKLFKKIVGVSPKDYKKRIY